MRAASSLCLLLILSFCAFPQGFGVGSGSSGGTTGQGVPFGPISRTAVVAGQPYSADGESQNIQTLADGTHIASSVTTWKFYRDAEGRTREERPLYIINPPATMPRPSGADPNISTTTIFITDPVAHVTYTLDSVQKVAHRRQRIMHDSPSERPWQGGESLGSQAIAGVHCEGSRVSKVLAVGAVGNDRPLSVVTEVWEAPDLQLVVLSKVNNPLTGERVQKLVNINRAEPPAELFQPPADYKVVDHAAISSTADGQPGDGVYRIGGDVSAPNLVSKVEPQYTEEARQAKYSGSVLLSVVVDENGVPRDIKVVRPLGMGLDEKAIEAVSRWRFKPGMKGGVAVPVRAQIEVSFRLLTKPPF